MNMKAHDVFGPQGFWESPQQGDLILLEFGQDVICMETEVSEITWQGDIVLEGDDALQELLKTCGLIGSSISEAEYQGRKVNLGKPFLTPDGPKKRSVYVKNPKTGNVIRVNFGDKKMRIKKSNPARRRSFRARHKCHTAKDRTKARYWSCKFW